MIRRNQGGEPTWTRGLRVRPVVESLEGREPPSGFAANEHLVLPLEAPLPTFQDVRPTVARPPVLLSPKASADEYLPPAGCAWAGTLATDAARAHPDRPPNAPAEVGLRAGTAAGNNSDGSGADAGLLRGSRTNEPPPKITGFHVSQNDDGTWTLSGRVKSLYAPLLRIRFGDPDGTVPSVNGQGTTVDDQDHFQFKVGLSPCEHGWVTAQTTADPNGRASKRVEDSVNQTGCGSQAGK